VSWENTDSSKTLADVACTDGADVAHVEDVESIMEVEVGLESEVNLGSFKFTLLSNSVTETVDELIFFVEVKDGLFCGADSNVAAARRDMARNA
jgi:hypothetical protein